MAEEIVNKVASSALMQIDLETFFPGEEVAVFDLKPHLFMELILKEKDFREALQKNDWTPYRDRIVTITCSADAIIPLWAYMLAASYLQPLARDILFGDREMAMKELHLRNIRLINAEDFRDQRVVIKGCGEKNLGAEAYVEITRILRPVAKSIMYGEPCSTVPIFKTSRAV